MLTPEKQRESHLKWLAKRKADPLRQALWREKQNRRAKSAPPCDPAKKKARSNRLREQLSDGYVAMTMGYKIADVPRPLLEIKRQILILNRTLKGKTNNDES